MKAIQQLTWAVILIASLVACKGKAGGGTKKGENLKGEDAKTYLAGKDNKYGQLESGHDYYQYITFDAANSADWKIEGTLLHFNDYKLVISRLSPYFL